MNSNQLPAQYFTVYALCSTRHVCVKYVLIFLFYLFIVLSDINSNYSKLSFPNIKELCVNIPTGFTKYWMTVVDFIIAHLETDAENFSGAWGILVHWNVSVPTVLTVLTVLDVEYSTYGEQPSPSLPLPSPTNAECVISLSHYCHVVKDGDKCNKSTHT